jgi:hypothetical protein
MREISHETPTGESSEETTTVMKATRACRALPTVCFIIRMTVIGHKERATCDENVTPGFGHEQTAGSGIDVRCSTQILVS